MNKVVTFLNEVKAEIRKITWPAKNDLIGTTIVVCFLTLVFAVLLSGMDVVFGFFIKKIL